MKVCWWDKKWKQLANLSNEMLYNGTKLSCDKTFYVYQLFSDKTLSSDNMLSCDKNVILRYDKKLK